MEIDQVNILINALINSIGNKTLCVEAKKFLRYCAYSLNRPIKKKLIFGRYQSYKRRNLKKPRSSGDENETNTKTEEGREALADDFFVRSAKRK